MGKGNFTWEAHDWAEFGAFKSQSPIDIPQSAMCISHLDSETQVKLRTSTRPMNVNCAYGSTGVCIDGPDLSNNLISINGRKGLMKEIHFHAPAEHLIDGVRHDAEMHCVFIRNDQVLGVVGFVLIADPKAAPNKFFQNFTWQLGEFQHQIQFNNNFLLDNFVVPNSKSVKRSRTCLFVHYPGSLTTPPCSETVNWFVQKSSVHPDDIAFLKILTTVHGGNYRLPQPLNDRKLTIVTMRSQIRTLAANADNDNSHDES